MVELSLTQKIMLRIFGYVSVGYRMKKGWKAPIEHFAFNCPIHGTIVDYRHGFAERLSCLLCVTTFSAARQSKQSPTTT